MDAKEREALYDAEIAPALIELTRRCEANGLSMIAHVEWDADESGTTAALVKGHGVGARLAYLAARCRGNVDALLIAVERYAREHGHGSIYLHRLGIPEKPSKAA